MMIKNSTQAWVPGCIVAVGFLRDLQVMERKAIKDYLPDLYLLRRVSTGKFYRFTPHHGIVAVDENGEWWLN